MAFGKFDLRKFATWQETSPSIMRILSLMIIPFEILLLTSGVGALQSAFFGLYLFSMRKGRSLANILLALLLLAFAIRIGKSLAYYFSDGHQVSAIIMNLGFGANLLIFPLLLLYLNSFFNKDFRFQWLRDVPQFLPGALAMLLSPYLTAAFWMQQHGYAVSLWSAVLYLPFCFGVIFTYWRSMSNAQKVWILGLAVGVTAVWAGYLANFIFGLVSYITGPVIFSVLIYFLTYVALRKSEIFIQREKYQRSTYGEQQINKCYDDLQMLLDTDHAYQNASLTLPKLAAMLHILPNLLSETINRRTGQTFPDYINGLRIRKARGLLKDPAYSQQKIITIAYETGFNSISVFNAAFKKHTNMTPSAYRKLSTRA